MFPVVCPKASMYDIFNFFFSIENSNVQSFYQTERNAHQHNVTDWGQSFLVSILQKSHKYVIHYIKNDWCF